MAAISVLDQQSRNGSFPTASLDVAVVVGAVGLDFLGVMSDADAANPASVCRITTEVSYDGSTYEAVDSHDWQGGSVGKDSKPIRPGFGSTFPAGKPAPQRIRATFDTLGQVLNFGATGEVTTG